MNRIASSNTGALPPVALIAGPTASGKSALAMALAQRTGGTIINADASQLYRDLRVLSARPSLEDEVRASHRLFGVIDGAIACSAAEWATQARGEIAHCHTQGSLPILVGGTGLYIRTLLNGIAPIPEIDPQVRAVIRAMPVNETYRLLEIADPKTAARLRPSDTTRVARALEVIRSTGLPLAHWQARTEGGIADAIHLVPLVLLPPRDWLNERINRRFADMLTQGAIEEIELLRVRALDPALPVMRAIGVREISTWLAGTIDRETMIEQAQTASRRYAKRQYTWFTHQPPSGWEWLDVQLDENNIDKIAIKLQEMILTH